MVIRKKSHSLNEQRLSSAFSLAKMEVWSLCDEWVSLMKRFLELKPFSASNMAGVQAALSLFSELVESRGFSVKRFVNPSCGADAVVAIRAPRGNAKRWTGLFGHVDIETIPDAQQWCIANPMVPTLQNERWYCRGIADNLGPLVGRLLTFSALDADCTGIVWTIHGEEEIGSPWAHQLYPRLKNHIPEIVLVGLWIEETGYFRRDGSQRALILHKATNPELMEVLLGRIEGLAKEYGKGVVIEERPLNKAFGLDKCPCLSHLLDGSVPYLAIGMNDSHSNIHTINESVPAQTLILADKQFRACCQ